MIPKDPAMLFSFINMRLRDFGMNLDELCADLDVERGEVEATLAKIDYHYDAARNCFK